MPFLLVLITFLFWYQTWFGRQLSDEDLGRYLADTSVPHKTQHALAQLAERITRGDAAAQQWYPQVIHLAESRESGFRLMAAWVMGQDNRSQEFHNALGKLLGDTDPMVRRNAALALVRFGDGAGRAELRATLQPYPVRASAAGRVTFRFSEGEAVRAGVAVAQVEPAAGNPLDIVSPVAGRLERKAVSERAAVSAGDVVAVIAPGEDQAWEALRALYLVGTQDELPEVERFAAGAGVSARVRQQAASTAEAIRHRAAPIP